MNSSGNCQPTEDVVLNPDSTLWVKIGRWVPARRLNLDDTGGKCLNTIAAWNGTVMNYERPILEPNFPLTEAG